MKHFCIHGIFRTGTNFARAVFEMNYDGIAEYDSFGWKHAPYPILSRGSRIPLPEIPSVFLTRNPILALSSLYSYARKNKRNISSAADDGVTPFLINRIVIRDGENSKSAELYFSNPVEMWNSLNWNYLSTVGKKADSFHVRYEDLVAEPEATTAAVAEVLGLERTSGEFKIPKNRMKNLGSNTHNMDRFQSDKTFNRDALSFERYSTEFEAGDLDFILARADRDLLRRAGYFDFLESLRKK